jgi:hypothetical protein
MSEPTERSVVDEEVHDEREGEDERTPDEIRADMDGTRAEMGDTLDQIGERLDPGHVAEQAKERVREATVGRVEEAVQTAGDSARGLGETVFETIKKNPIPAAVAGIGIAWLWMNREHNGSQKSGRSEVVYAGVRPGGHADYNYRQVGSQEGGQGLTDRAGNAVSDAGNAVSGAAGEAGQRAGQVAGDVGERVSEFGEEAGRMAGSAGGQLRRTFEDAPLAVGAVALGAGVAIGLLVPETEPEHRFMGEISDDVTQAAGEKISEAVDKGTKVAERTVESAGETAKQEAEREGIVS